MSGPAHKPGTGWSSRLAFLIASIGFAVGLGNIWRFPYLAGENGGAAFIIVYIAAVFFIGLPLVIAELAIGRAGGPEVAGAWKKVAEACGASPRWRIVGYLGVFANFAIGSFYCVIGGWTLAFAWNAIGQLLSSGPATDFGALLASPAQLMFWQSMFLAANVAIVSIGLRGGLERVVTFLMPLLFVLMIGLLAIAVASDGFAPASSFLFSFEPEQLTMPVTVQAVGQAFFSVGVGLAVLTTYGGYLDKGAKLGRLAVIIVSADTLVAILAGLVIFPFVFAAGLEPGEGPTLVFVTMQTAFASMGDHGQWLAASFFALVAVAALTSSVGLFELLAAMGEGRGMSRRRTLGWVGAMLWLLGLGTVASFNIGANFHPLGAIPTFEGATILGVIDILTANVALPLGGLLIALFAGWFTPRESWAEAIGWEADAAPLHVWIWSLRIVVPVLLMAVLAAGVGA